MFRHSDLKGKKTFGSKSGMCFWFLENGQLNESTLYGVYWSSSPQKDRIRINQILCKIIHGLAPTITANLEATFVHQILCKIMVAAKSDLCQSIHRVHVHLWGFSSMASRSLMGNWWLTSGGNRAFPCLSHVLNFTRFWVWNPIDPQQDLVKFIFFS